MNFDLTSEAKLSFPHGNSKGEEHVVNVCWGLAVPAMVVGVEIAVLEPRFPVAGPGGLSWKCRRHVGNVSATCQNVANLDPTCVSGPTHNSKIAEPTQNLSVGYPYIRTHIYVPEYNTLLLIEDEHSMVREATRLFNART